VEVDDSSEWWMWTGGLFGALLVVAVALGIPSLGAVRFTVIFLTTQLITAIVADALGLFGYDRVPLNAYGGRRIVGATLATAAAISFKLLQPPESWKWANEWPCTSWKIKDEECLIHEDTYVVPISKNSFHIAIHVADLEQQDLSTQEGESSPATTAFQPTNEGYEIDQEEALPSSEDSC
jgi:hypothetical protein